MELILGDCLEELKKIEDSSIDCVVTSPPYNMRTRIRNGKYTTRETSEHFSKKYKHFSDDLGILEYKKYHLQVLRELLRVSSLVFWNIQIVTGSKEAIFKIIGELSEYIRDIIVWDKVVAQPAMHEGVLNRGYELIVVFESPARAGRAFSKYEFKRGTMYDVWKIKTERGFSGHSAVFPELLVAKILNGWTKKGDLVLDCFMGSGTTGVVCKKLNRDFIGIEIVPEYYNLAKERIENTPNSLFS